MGVPSCCHWPYSCSYSCYFFVNRIFLMLLTKGLSWVSPLVESRICSYKYLGDLTCVEESNDGAKDGRADDSAGVLATSGYGDHEDNGHHSCNHLERNKLSK